MVTWTGDMEITLLKWSILLLGLCQFDLNPQDGLRELFDSLLGGPQDPSRQARSRRGSQEASLTASGGG
jgi:hypothetical protein